MMKMPPPAECCFWRPLGVATVTVIFTMYAVLRHRLTGVHQSHGIWPSDQTVRRAYSRGGSQQSHDVHTSNGAHASYRQTVAKAHNFSHHRTVEHVLERLTNSSGQYISMGGGDPGPKPGPVRRLYKSSFGRLGNLMFQLSSSVALAASSGRRLVVDGRIGDLLEGVFGAVAGGGVGRLGISVGPTPVGTRVVHESCSRCFSQPQLLTALAAIPGDAEVRAYLESWRYMPANLADQLRRDVFVFRREIQSAAEAIVGAVWEHHRKLHCRKKNADCPLFHLVGVHVRRGSDVTSEPGISLPTPEYYQHALSKFRKRFREGNVHYMVVTDAPGWALDRVILPWVTDGKAMEVAGERWVHELVQNAGAHSQTGQDLQQNGVKAPLDKVPREAVSLSMMDIDRESMDGQGVQAGSEPQSGVNDMASGQHDQQTLHQEEEEHHRQYLQRKKEAENHKVKREEFKWRGLVSSQHTVSSASGLVDLPLPSSTTVPGGETWGQVVSLADVSLSVGHAAQLDLAVLAACHAGTVLSYGTFGWWGAWLAQAEQVLYWDGGGNNTYNRDFYPPEWTPIE